MKDILILVKQRQDGYRESYNRLKTEAPKNKESVREVLGTAFLLTGPKSFEIAMSFARIAFEENLQLAFFEIESNLLCPNNVDP